MKPATDQLPPNDLTAEKAIIGCAIQDGNLAAELRTDWFYDLRNREAAGVLLKLSAAGQPVNAVTALQAIQAAGISESAALVGDCDDACPSPADWPHWRDILTGKLALRKIIKTAQEAIASAYDASQGNGNPADCLDTFEKTALAVRQQLTRTSAGDVDNRAALLELANEYELASKNGRPRGMVTGFYDLDQLIGGLKPQNLFIIAARPAVGKTSLALSIAERVALDDGLPSAFFSLEMSGKELLHRLACSRARVNGAALNDGSATEREIMAITSATAKISKAPLFICDAGGLTVAQLTARARRMVQQHGVKILFVDYLGLLRSGDKGRSRYEETTLVSNALKALAKELNLPVIVLAQLNRDNDREGRAPRLSDLRDSGAIEQDADLVGLLHRDESQTGECQTVSLILAKNRAGRTGKIELIFNRNFTRFENKSE